MNNPLLGINTLSETDISAIRQLSLIKAAGFDAFFTGWDHTDAEKIANEAARLGLVQQSIHSPFSGKYNVSHLWGGGEDGDFVREALMDCIRDCAHFDVPVMVIHPFIGFTEHDPTQTGLDNYARIIELANKLGVKLGFENVEGEEYLAAIMESFWNEPSVGFCLDTGHQMCYNRGKDMLALYGEKLVHTHINDNLGVRGDNITFYDDLHLLPGDGIIDWNDVMKKIRAIGYNDILMSELTYVPRNIEDTSYPHYTHMSIERFLSEAYERLKLATNV